MKIKGKVVSGCGEGSYYMSQKIYLSQFKKKLGFTPFKGTLNIKVDNSVAVEDIKKKCKKIKGEGKFGDVLYIEAKLNDIDGAIIFPLKTKHDNSIIEYIAPVKVREKLGLKDGDKVCIKVL
ncbi:CTP-dependent riboflavin kinase [Methanothermus fervidus DSM 2088]|uniref:Riboflavin kinase n=1 Tax=Methanothermus fervidus (strain ATCC 43054 / DSM 2088 / JCM 10308 / V24 S) TaxID=523846 RepID=E3GXW4_METFV|nr:DUF120 domain-containing protein [Methanothermus fervidus]ADP77146.1 CTP-dependent riboflavin kinase [Methanothermus fervidus DSM 2088]